MELLQLFTETLEFREKARKNETHRLLASLAPKFTDFFPKLLTSHPQNQLIKTTFSRLALFHFFD